MSAIVDIIGREILDSRGNPTVECDVLLESGVMGRAAVPSGASTGSREAIELRDGDKGRYLGKGVQKAIENINTEIAEAVMGLEANEQAFLDHSLIELDGTENKMRLGANATLAVSMAVAKAAAEEVGLPLYRYFGGSAQMQMPVPMMNVINGGAHANNNLDLQELMIVPIGAPTFSRGGALRRRGVPRAEEADPRRRHEHRGRRRGRLRAEREEPRGGDPADPAGHREGRLRAGRADRAGARLRRERVLQGRQVPPGRRGAGARGGRLDQRARDLVRQVPDRVDRGRHGRERLGRLGAPHRQLGKRVQLVGDDLFVTNTKIFQEGIRRGIANSILIKINQIGTLTETFAAIEMAKRAGYTAVVSHRSGETEDTTIADIAVGTNAMQIKTGSMSRSDRIAKYNQLLRIEEDLGEVASYPGRAAFYSVR